MTSLTITGTAATVKVSAPANLGAANDTVTLTTASTLQVRSDGAGSNGTISFGNNITYTLAVNGTLDLGNSATANIGNTVAFGTLTNNQTTGAATLTVTAANGYKASLTNVVLPGGTGNTTNIVASAPVTIGGNITNVMTGFGVANFDTIVLDGGAGGTINGTINDAATATMTTGGQTKVTKQGTGTWVLNPGGTGNSYIGVTTVTSGTLQSGANNAVSSATGSGLSITAAAGTATAPVTATLDLAGFNQTLSESTGTISGVLNDALTMGGGSAFSQAILTNSTGSSTLTLSGTTGSNGDVQYVSTNNPLEAIISVTNLAFGGAARTFNVGDSTTAPVDLLISSVIADGGFGLVKKGAGLLQITNTGSAITGLVDIQVGTLSTAYAFPDTATILNLGNSTNTGTLQWVGAGGFTFNTRAITLNGTTGGGTLDNEGANGSNAMVINTPLAFGTVSSGTKTLTLTGTNTDNNTIGALSNNGTSVTNLAKTGVGKWIIGANSTITGTLAVSGGQLDIGAFNLSTGAATISAAGASITGTTGLFTATSFTASNATGNVTISAIMAGSGTLTKNAAGTLTLSGANTFTGTVSDTVGNIIISNSQGLGAGPKTISIIPTTNPTSLPGLELDGSGGPITLAANLSFTTSFDALNAGVPIANNGAIINLAGNNTILGNFTLTSGGGGTTFLSEAGNLNIAGNISANTTLRSVDLRGAGTGQVTGVISDGADPVALDHDDGTGIWTISGSNTFTGGTNIDTGAIRLGGGDNRLLSTGAGATNVVTLGSGAISGKLIIGGDAAGGTGAGNQHGQTLTQNNAASILTTSGTGTNDTVVGGADGGTSAGTPANNSVLTLNILTGFTDIYNGLFGGTGTFENNINVVKSGGGILVLSADFSNWTGIQTDAPNTDLTGDATRPTLTVSGGVLQLNPGAVINTVILNTGGVINDLGATYGNNSFIVTSGGLIALSNTTDSFENSSITASSHGVAALNIPGNTGVVDFAGSDVYLGAIGARIFSGATLAAGSGSTYRFGGGAPWNALGTVSIGGSGGYLQITSANVITGANNVIIGDNGSYNGDSGLFGGESTVQFTQAQNYTGITILAGGSLVVTNLNELGNPSTVAGSIVLDGGIFRYSGITTDISNLLTIGGGGSIDTNGQAVTFATGIGNSNTGTSGLQNGGLTKIGNGVLTLAAVNSYTGATDLFQGGLTLDLNAAGANNVLSSVSTLLLDGGSLGVKGTGGTTTRSQTFTATTFNSGNSSITPTLNATSTTGNVLTLALGSLGRASGATGNIVFTTGNTTATNTQITQTSIVSSNTLITDGNGVAYLTFGTSATSIRDWAVTGASASQIVQAPASGFYTAATASTVTGNADIGALSPTVTGAVGDNPITSIRFDNAGARTLTLNGATSTFSIGGILVTSNVGNNATTIAGSATLQGASLGVGDLTIFDYDTSSSLTISEPIGGTGGLTKSGTGTVVLSGTNTYGGQTVINGGTLSLSAAAQYGNTTGFTLNGGTLTWSATANLAKVFTLGLNGGTLNITGAGNESVGTAGDNLLFLGTGARTLTLNSVGDRKMTFNFVIGDDGGPTSLAINGASSTSYMVLNANNTYTGTTTITLGILQLATAGSLPGGLGGTTLTPANTGGGNLTFAATSTNRAILELTAASGDFMRPLGTGFDQVQWTGNGGFSNAGTGIRIVNLGGASAGVTWGSGGFVPTGSILDFGQGAANSLTSGGAIDFQNPINLGGAIRTIDVSNGIQNNSIGVDGMLSGALTGTTGGGLTKTGNGVLKLTGNNATGTDANSATTVSGGFLVLASASPTDVSALPGSGTNNRTVTINANAAVVLSGQADPTALLNRVVTTSAGAVDLDTNSSATIDLSAFSSLALGAYNDIGGTAVYFSGTLLPNANSYRFADATLTAGSLAGPVGTSIQTNNNILVLSRANMLADNGAILRSATFGSGEFYLTGYNTYSGGTVVSGNATGSNSQVGIGNDAAFGTGPVTASPTTASTSYFGSVNGDHTLSNNLTLGLAGNLVLAGNTANRGLANYGAMTYLGTINLPATTSLFSEGNADAIVLGSLNPSGASTAVTFSNNSGGLFSLLTTPAGAAAKSYTSSILVSGSTLVIDSDLSLGAAPATAATNITFSTATATLEIQPGAAPVILNSKRNISLTANIGATINVPGGTQTINGVTTGGLTTNDSLTIPGNITGGGTGVFLKSGLGTLVLQGTNTFTATSGNAFQIQAGTVQLDYADLVGAGPILNNTTLMQLTLGTGTNGNLSAGATLLITAGPTAAVTQNFSTTLFTAKDDFITLNSSGATITLGLGTTITRNAIGSTLNFNGNALSSLATIHSSYAGANGIVPGATWGGTDLVGANGSALSQYTGYTPLSGTSSAPTITSATATNIKVDNSTTGNVTLAAAALTSVNTLTYSDPTARTIDVRDGATAETLNFGTVGTVLDGTGAGALTIGVSGSAGTLTAGGPTTTTSGELVFINDSSNTLTVNSVLANNGGTGAVTTVVKSGSGVLSLTGADTYSGSTYVNSGVLQYADGSASAKSFGSPTAGATNIILNGGALRFAGTTSNNLIWGITVNGNSAIDVPNATGTINQTAQGITGIAGAAGLLQKTGAGTLTLSGTSDDPNASIEVVTGTFNLAKSSSSTVHAVSGGAGAAALIIDSGATASITGTGGDQIYDGSSVVVKTGGTLNLSSTVGVGESFDGLAGGGSVTSSAAVTLSLGGSAANAAASNNESDIGPNTLAAANAGVASTGLNNFSGVIGGNIALTKYGAGLQILGGNNTYSGATNITAGTLKMALANALPSGTGKGDVTIVGNTSINGLIVPGMLDLGGFDQAINGLNSTTGGFVTNTIPLVWGGSSWSATAGTNTLTIGANGDSGTFNGIFQDGFTVVPNPGTGAGTGVGGILALFKTGAGTESLSGANTASGPLTVNQGEVDLNATGVSAWSGNVTVNTTGTLKLIQSQQLANSALLTVSGGTFELNGNTETVGGVSLTANGVIQDTPTGGALTSTTAFDLEAGSASAVLSGSIGANKTTTGTVILSGANTYTGPTSVQNGILSVSTINSVTGGAASGNLGAPTTIANGTIALGNGATTGTLLYTGPGETTDRVVNLAGATGGGTLDQSGTGLLNFTSDLTATGAGSKTLTLQGSTAGTGQISGAIVDGSGTTAVTKAGTGTWILSGNSNYSGPTNVNGGKLVVSGSLAGNVNVATGATFASGNNTTSQIAVLNATSDINGGGTVAPGDTGGSATTTIGQLNVTGNVSLGTASTAGVAHLSIELGGTTAGVSYDQIAMSSGTLSLANVELDGSLINSYAPAFGDTLYIIAGVGSASGTLAFTNQQAPDSNSSGLNTITFGGQEFAISFTALYHGGVNSQFTGAGNDVALMAIPEPNSLAMLAGSFGLALGLQRFRRRRA